MQYKNKRIGLFGGTFNPIHFGHLKMAECALEKFNLDLIYFIPSGNPPHKNKNLLLPKKIRYELVKIAIKKNKNFKILDLEIKKRKPCYTIDTIKNLYRSNFKNLKNLKLFFIIGQDEFENLDNWHKINELATLVEFIVLPRVTNKKIKKIKINNLIYHYLKVKPIKISSTQIRKKLCMKKL